VLYAQNLENGECYSRRISHDVMTILYDMDKMPLTHLD